MTEEIELKTQPENDAVRDTTGTKLIIGQKPLSDEQVTMMNIIKTKGNEVGAMLDTMAAINIVGDGVPAPYDPRWIATAKTHLQIGFMLLCRAVGQPDSF